MQLQFNFAPDSKQKTDNMTCPACGKSFRVKPSKASQVRCCSRACSARWKSQNALGYDPKKRVEKHCVICNKVIWVKKSHAEFSGTYCSRECMAVGYKERLRGEANPHYKNAGWHDCPTCGNAFRSYNKKARFCSVPCARRTPENRSRAIAMLKAASARKHVRAVRARMFLPQKSVKFTQKPLSLHFVNRQKRNCEVCGKVFYTSEKRQKSCSERCRRALIAEKQKDRVVLTCIVCGEPFEVPYSNVIYLHRVTCSRGCLKKWRRERQLGERSHRWKGGKTSHALIVRGSAPYSEWRTKVFERDDFTCHLCGQRGGKLTAHHIYLFSTHKELRMKVENGITLCWDCHKGIRGKEKSYQQQFAEKTTLDIACLEIRS